MKKIKRVVAAFVLITIIFSSTPSLGQISRETGLFECELYPTVDATLNSNVSHLIAQNDFFERKMSTIYENLSETDKQQVDVYIRNNDETLFTAYPQFDDEELKNDVIDLKEKYATLLNRYKQLNPQLSGEQYEEEVRNILKCASSKAKVEMEGRMAVDDCELQRRNCIVAVGAESAVMHAGCAALDLTFFAGIICHGAAFVYQYTAGNNCNIAARQCAQAQH